MCAGEVVRHTGEEATEDVKLLNLCRLLVTVDGVAISEGSTTVGDGCGSRTRFCDDNCTPSVVGIVGIVGGSVEIAPWKVQNLLVVSLLDKERKRVKARLILPFIFQVVVGHTTIVGKTAVYARSSDCHHDDFTRRP